MSLKESSRLVEETKEREVKMQSNMKAMELQIQALNEREQEVSCDLTPNIFLIYKANTRCGHE